MSEIITAKFNVSAITNYGNAAGTKVKLLPAIGAEQTGDCITNEGSITLHFAGENPFEFGFYDVTFSKEGTVRKPYQKWEEVDLDLEASQRDAVISQLKNDLFFAKSELCAQHKTQARFEKKIQRLKSKNAHLKAKLALKDLPLKG